MPPTSAETQEFRNMLIALFAPALNEALGSTEFDDVMSDIKRVEDYLTGEPK